MKKILISLVIVVVFGLYLWFQHGGNAQDVVTDTTSPTPVSDSPTSTPTATPAAATPTQATSGLKDGAYTSAVFDATYGPMQVKATISGGKLTNVEFVQFPNAAGHTTEVSNQSLPILKSEALAAQSSKVDIVSGATQTSEAFIQALASVLVKART